MSEARSRRLASTNIVWGWVAAAVVMALVMVFVFTRGLADCAPIYMCNGPVETRADWCCP